MRKTRSLRTVVRALLLATAFVCGAAPAATVPDLYQASVPVPSQDPNLRDGALRQALMQVLVRVTGDRTAGDSAMAAPILARATALALSVGYEQPDPANPQSLVLTARFDGRAIESALRQAGLPVWGATRPEHLLWIGVDDGARRALLGESDLARVPALLAAAHDRGLPVRLPAMDPQDQTAVAFSDLLSVTGDRLLQASKRYGAPQVVACRASREAGAWTAHWALLTPSGIRDTWESFGASLDAALADGIESLADRQAAQLAVRGGAGVQDITLFVAGIASMDDYGRVLNYLQSRNGVQSVAVLEVLGDGVSFRVRNEGDADALDRSIEAGSLLQRDPAPAAPAPAVPTMLDYRLVH